MNRINYSYFQETECKLGIFSLHRSGKKNPENTFSMRKFLWKLEKLKIWRSEIPLISLLVFNNVPLSYFCSLFSYSPSMWNAVEEKQPLTEIRKRNCFFNRKHRNRNRRTEQNDGRKTNFPIDIQFLHKFVFFFQKFRLFV